MISKEDVIADLLKEYETYGTLREKLAIQLEALGAPVLGPTTLDLMETVTHGMAAITSAAVANGFRVPPKAN